MCELPFSRPNVPPNPTYPRAQLTLSIYLLRTLYDSIKEYSDPALGSACGLGLEGEAKEGEAQTMRYSPQRSCNLVPWPGVTSEGWGQQRHESQGNYLGASCSQKSLSGTGF